MAMWQTTPQRPFELLAGLESLGHAQRIELPGREERRDEWRGLGFRLGGQRLVAALDELVEILMPPRVARVPHTKRWVHGVANVRGNLLPIMDLSDYLGKGKTNLTRLSRVLVIEQPAVFAGLLVDEVLGMRHFLYPEQWRPLVDFEEDAVMPYSNGVLHRDGSDWLVFSLKTLTSHPEFHKVAA